MARRASSFQKVRIGISLSKDEKAKKCDSAFLVLYYLIPNSLKPMDDYISGMTRKT